MPPALPSLPAAVATLAARPLALSARRRLAGASAAVVRQALPWMQPMQRMRSTAGRLHAGHFSTCAPATDAAVQAASSLHAGHIRHLRQHGFCVVDPAPSPHAAGTSAANANVASDSACFSAADVLRREILQLRPLMSLNHTHLVHGSQRSLVAKQAIHELDFQTSPAAPAILESSSFWRTLLNQQALLQRLNALLQPDRPAGAAGLLDRQTWKAQINAGDGGCFPLHCDTDVRVDARYLTAILYLNPAWQPSHGGQLRLYPFPHAPLDIAPLHGRLVLFDSARMLHRVLPSQQERVCITVWMWKAAAAQLPAATPPPSADQLRSLYPAASPDELAALASLLSPSLRPHVAKLLHSLEWLSSLEESHPSSSADTQHMLMRHIDDCERVELALRTPLSQLRLQPADSHADVNSWRRWFPTPQLPGAPLHLPPGCQIVGESESNAASIASDAAAPHPPQPPDPAVPLPAPLVSWLC